MNFRFLLGSFLRFDKYYSHPLNKLSYFCEKIRDVDIKAAVEKLKTEGKILIKEGHGTILELASLEKWDPNSETNVKTAVFLLFDVFQIRSISEQFSDVSLDVIEFASKPTVYHTIKGRFLKNGPVVDGEIKFSVIKKDFWNKLLFTYGNIVVLNYPKGVEADFETEEYFPLLSAGTKEMFLSPDGDIKIIRG